MAARKPIAKSRGAAKRGPKTPMTDEHKSALSVGRAEAKAVREYLESLRVNRPRGRRRTTASMRTRLKAIDAELLDTDPVTELKLRQERKDLVRELEQRAAGIDRAALEEAFVAVAKSYSRRQGINYVTWREFGVGASVLERAGIDRSV